MAEFIVMPKLGLTMTEGTVSNWRKKEGDNVKSGEVLFDVETDKISNEVEATSDGVIRKIFIEEGTVEVLKPVAIVASADEDISSLLTEIGGGEKEEIDETIEKKEIKEEASTATTAKKVKASPKAKKLAAELNVDISRIEGTGTQSSVTEEDVRKFVKESKKAEKKTSPTAAVVAEQLGVDINQICKDSRIMKDDVIAYKEREDFVAMVNPQEIRKSMSTMRKVIAKRMLESQQVSPTVNYNLRVDTTNLSIFRNQIKDTVKVTYTDLLVKILSKALLEFPLLNSSIEGNEIIFRNYVSIGVAVGLEDGLLVPVVEYANSKGLKEISKEIKELATKAKNNELQPQNLTGGTFTITNIGMFGIESFTPIINQPEVAILGVNAIVQTPVAVEGQVTIKPLMNLSLTADHRVVDGSVAAQFMARVKEYIEKPALLLL
ncbi:pyruvate dehydrogenase E2 component (dihydrolipoamide acetyltransferase) [Alkalibaculum bacchi]|uniref:Dihydrolipoamide acetyltransferase component of pyruvate dehydrogenase complex n=1 Tax=Alkalibaculum bacchi TaxID=645887 RepID=A0A366IFH8_9FIRM|nr:dihydrolipoamide acetyltransferase family protein [Alkalibaculum bacchi]RBP68876.1 pyruvate dehydrogenase E2 component (dihydrolipoamide acetyltransferase) [Alkalibaculum bacchi]